MSKFILLLHEAPDGFPPDISPDQIQAIIQRYVVWRQKIQQTAEHPATAAPRVSIAPPRVTRSAPTISKPA